jgi:hypothetical protein
VLDLHSMCGSISVRFVFDMRLICGLFKGKEICTCYAEKERRVTEVTEVVGW